MRKRYMHLIVGVLLVSSMIISACKKDNSYMTLGTTTTTQDSGLLDYLIPKFEEDTGIKVKLVAKGTGEILALAKQGNIDCLMVHDKEKELKFIEEGYGIKRYEVMYNDFIIVGPMEDSAEVKAKASKNPAAALKLISDKKAVFISRGDDSGTDSKEKSLWKMAKVSPEGNWYISAGRGAGAVLQMANEKGAYTLTDRANYLSMKDKISLQIVTENNENLHNQYSLVKLNNEKLNNNAENEDRFIKWMLSEKAQKLIGEFGKDKFGQSLFIPNAKQ